MASSKLENEIIQTRTFLKQIPPPKKAIRQFFESSLQHPINEIGEKITHTQDISQMADEHIKLIRLKAASLANYLKELLKKEQLKRIKMRV